MTATLRHCSECGQRLPSDWEWDVRSLAWLEGLPRRISPTNNDLEIHDGVGGRRRFLHIEFKPDDRPLDKGQAWHLSDKARTDRYVVLVVRGRRTGSISVSRYSSRGEPGQPIATTCDRLAIAIRSWLNGALWRDAEEALTERRAPLHDHDWQETATGSWVCAVCGAPYSVAS